MKYCVKKDTTIIIDGSKNPEEIMLENAISSGFLVEEVEILTEDEYKVRVDSLPVPITPKTDIEILQEQLETIKLASSKSSADFQEFMDYAFATIPSLS